MRVVRVSSLFLTFEMFKAKRNFSSSPEMERRRLNLLLGKFGTEYGVVDVVELVVGDVIFGDLLLSFFSTLSSKLEDGTNPCEEITFDVGEKEFIEKSGFGGFVESKDDGFGFHEFGVGVLREVESFGGCQEDPKFDSDVMLKREEPKLEEC